MLLTRRPAPSWQACRAHAASIACSEAAHALTWRLAHPWQACRAHAASIACSEAAPAPQVEYLTKHSADLEKSNSLLTAQLAEARAACTAYCSRLTAAERRPQEGSAGSAPDAKPGRAPGVP